MRKDSENSAGRCWSGREEKARGLSVARLDDLNRQSQQPAFIPPLSCLIIGTASSQWSQGPCLDADVTAETTSRVRQSWPCVPVERRGRPQRRHGRSLPQFIIHHSSLIIHCSSLIILLVLTAAPASAQTLRGFARDAEDGLALVGVNIALNDGAGGLYGNASNLDGFYTVSRFPAGTYTVTASYLGYRTHIDTLTFAVDEVITYNVELEPQSETLDEVVVEAESETAGAAAVAAGLQTILPRDIENIPTPDVSGDLVSYIQTIPGVVTSGDQGGQLFIRGGEPTQNLVLLDGMLIYQPFHLIGFYSAFPSDILNSTDVYAGGFGARFGGRISSVIDISARSGSKRRFGGSVSLAPFVSGVLLEGPLARDRVSFLFSGRTSVIEQGASRLVDEELPYSFNDLFGKLHVAVSQNHQASITALSTRDRGTVGKVLQDDPNARVDEVVWRNEAIGFRYILLPVQFPVHAEILMSSSRVANEFGPTVAPSRSADASQFNAATNVTHYLGTTDFKWGVYLRSSTLESEFGGTFQNLEANAEYVTEAGAYIEPEFNIDFGTGLVIQPGLRAQTFPSKSRTFVEPRLRVVLNYGLHRFSFAGGIYHQEIVGINDRRDAGDVFTAWTTSRFNDVAEAVHLLGGYQLSLPLGLDFSVEGYRKTLSSLSTAEWTAFPRFSTRLQPANGDVIGGDIRMELSAGWFYGFVNYGYAEVEYRAMQASLPIWYGVDELVFPPPHDRRHQGNALVSIRFAKFKFSTRWQYGSGLPFSESLGFDEFILVDGPIDVTEESGDTRVLYGLPYRGRLPDYHRLDVSLDREITIARNVTATLQASVTNTYDRNNVFYVDLFTLRRVDQLPLIPSFGVKLEFR